ASFSNPKGLALGADGALYVADSGNNKIRRVSAGGEVVTIAGTGAAGALDGSGNTATFNSPCGLVQIHGALIMSDQLGHRLRQLTLKAGGSASPSSASSWQVNTLAGSGGTGSADGRGDVATFNHPSMLAVDASGNLIVADFANNKIRKVTPS